jgi:hypothetical protein
MAKLQKLSLETLDQLDMGKISATLEVHLRRAIADCEDRPLDPKARSVTLQFDMTPIVTDDRDCTEANLQVQCHSKVPTHKTRVYNMGIRKFDDGHALVFNPDSPGNVNQQTFMNGEDD